MSCFYLNIGFNHELLTHYWSVLCYVFALGMKLVLLNYGVISGVSSIMSLGL